MNIRVVNKRLICLHSRQLACNIRTRHDELPRSLVCLRFLVFPPQHFWTMVAGGGASSKLGDSIACVPVHPLDVRLAAHIEPRVEVADRPKLLIDQSHACHLRIERDGCYLVGINAARLNAQPDRPGCRVVEILMVLFHHPGFGIIQRNLLRRLGNKLSVDLIKCGLSATGSEVNTDQVLFSHCILRKVPCKNAGFWGWSNSQYP